jgi:hypothetical protein
VDNDLIEFFNHYFLKMKNIINTLNKLLAVAIILVSLNAFSA